MGNSASAPARKPGSSMRARLPARANHSAARVDGAVALRARSFSRLQAASMPACNISSEPNSFTLPLISSNKALGSSMLTNEVNVLRVHAEALQRSGRRSASVSSGNTTAYHKCFETRSAYGLTSAAATPALACGTARSGCGRGCRRARASRSRLRQISPPSADFAVRDFTTASPTCSTGPGRPPCTLSRSRCGSCSPFVSNKRKVAGEDSKRCRSGRNSTPRAPPASAASFKRRSQRSSVPFNHSNTAAQTPELKACSAAHKASVAVAGRTTNKRPSSIPCCAKAGA